MFYIQSRTGKHIEVPGHRGLKYWKLRTPEAVKRRRAYKARQPKRKRIHCSQCRKRFVPKRVTAQYCSNACRQKHHREQWATYNRLGFVDEWKKADLEFKAMVPKLEYMQGRYRHYIMNMPIKT